MRLVLPVACFAALVSCTGTEQSPSPPAANSSSVPPVTPSDEPVTDADSFVAALEAVGHEVQQGPVRDLPGFEGFGIPARKVSMDGVDVWALEYPNVAAYENAGLTPEIVARSGHSPQVEAPDDVVRIVASFVK